MEILNYGISVRTSNGALIGSVGHLRTPRRTPSSGCSTSGSTRRRRPALRVRHERHAQRERLLAERVVRHARGQRAPTMATTADMTMGGVMHYVELDVGNLKRWFARTGAHNAGTGNQALNQNGYIVYFSDRRSNRNGTAETGEYGYEDVVNPASAAGTANGTLQTGEDVQSAIEPGFGSLQTYGETPPSQPAGALTPYTTAAGLGRRPRSRCRRRSSIARYHVPAGAEASQRRDQRRRQQPADLGPDGRLGEPGLRAGQLQRDDQRDGRTQRAGGNPGRLRSRSCRTTGTTRAR